MNEVNYFIFRCSSSKTNVWCFIFKVPHGVDEWNTNWRKDIKRENPKKNYLPVKYINLNINL